MAKREVAVTYIDGKRIPDPTFLRAWAAKQAARRSVAEQERHLRKQRQLIDGLRAIPLALDWLSRHGFQVIGYENGTLKQPEIVVMPGPACQLLKAHYQAYDYQSHVTQGQGFRLWRAELLGCYINWSEGMN